MNGQALALTTTDSLVAIDKEAVSYVHLGIHFCCIHRINKAPPDLNGSIFEKQSLILKNI